MLPSRASLGLGDTFQAANVAPRQFAGPILPAPNPNLGSRMANRDWQAREAAVNYEMRQAPMPWQYTGDPNQDGHPDLNSGWGNQLTQYMAPNGPPTGYAARGMTQSQIDAYTPRRGLGIVPYARPSYAYNRLPGVNYMQALVSAPTMYATWPLQGYPQGSNTYVPSFEATGTIIKYTRNPSFFRVNRYIRDLTVKTDQGYYLTLSGDDPYRVVSIYDYLWEDSADAPGGRQERQAFGFNPYKTVRYAFPFSLGSKSVDQASWAILAEHAAMMAAKAMTVRTMLAYTLLTTSANWTGSWGTNYSAASGQWTNAASNTNNYIQTDLNTACIAIEQASGGIVSDEDALQFTLNPQEARGIARSYEYKQYIQGSPDALAAITDWRNPNRRYGLAPYLYGLALTVENAIVVTTPKPGNVASQPSTTRSYVWAQGYGAITSKPRGISSEGEQSLDFSTVCYRFYEQMTTEQKNDADNRRQVGRVVEDYTAQNQAPQTGYLLTGLT